MKDKEKMRLLAWLCREYSSIFASFPSSVEDFIDDEDYELFEIAQEVADREGTGEVFSMENAEEIAEDKGFDEGWEIRLKERVKELVKS